MGDSLPKEIGPVQTIQPDWWLFGVCSARVLTYLVFMTYPAVLPVVQREWGMSAAAAGSISSGFHLGYAVSLMVFSELADRIGAKRVVLFSHFLSACSALAFAFFARGYFSCLFLYTLIGLSLGGTYPPVLIMLTDRYPGRHRGRAMGFFIASTSMGYTLSLLTSGWGQSIGGYRTSFFLTSLGPSLGFLLAWFILASTPNKIFPRRREQGFSTEVLRNKKAMLYIGGYAFHSWELLGMWAWTPAFLSVCLAVTGAGVGKAAGGAAYIVGLFHLVGVSASLSMGVLSDRFGRTPVILVLAGISTACSFTMGWLVGLPVAFITAVGMVYAFSALGDSPVLSAGLTETVDSSYMGAAFALRSLFGFGAGAVSPLVFGAILDWLHPETLLATTHGSWGWSYSMLGLGGLGVLCVNTVLHRGVRS